MDRNFFYQKRAEEHQREISRELANRHLLSDGRHDPLTTNQARRLVLRLASVAIAMTVLLLFTMA